MTEINPIKSALICGISGQDGAYLAEFLLKKDYIVFGTSRDVEATNLYRLKHLKIDGAVQLFSMLPEDFRSVLVAIQQCQPDELYFLAGQSSVGLSFSQPTETIKSIVLGTLNILDACRMIDKEIRCYFAGSSECFGDTGDIPATEKTPFLPKSPYAVAKSSAYWLVNNYRDAYSMYACTGILFNHESPLRPKRFVTQKIISTAKRISSGSKETLELGNIDIVRDWGWAPDYIKAMWLMLQQNQAEDFIVATGKSSSLEHFVENAFQILGLNWQEHTKISKDLLRPTDIKSSKADPSYINKKLNWKTSKSLEDIIGEMINTKQLP